jgi:membrane protein DedA with SNARE-associated domain
MFLLQLLLTATPMPRLVAGALAGFARYSVLRFLLAQTIGEGAHNALLVTGGVFFRRFPWFIRFAGLARQPLTWLVTAAVMGVAWFVRRRRTAD